MSEPVIIDDDPAAALEAVPPAAVQAAPVPEAATASIPSRRRIGFVGAAVVSDLGLALIAYVVALSLRQEAGYVELREGLHPNWSMLVVLSVMLGVFYLFGLYERELLLSRTLHVWTLLRAVVVAFLIGGGAIYLFRLPIVLQSRAVVIGAFVLFFLLAAVLRVGVLTSLFWHREPAVTLVVGDADYTARLRERLRELRVFRQVQTLDTGCGGPDSAVWFKAMLSQTLAASPGRVANVFIDADCLKPNTAFDLIAIAQRSGAHVYVVSNLVRSLSCRRLLFDLFEVPVVGVRRGFEVRPISLAERAFDIGVAGAVLVLTAPLMLVVAVAIKLSSPGPVFHTQERVGRDGKTFTFYKFRSMTVANDDESHVRYMQQFIRRGAEERRRQSDDSATVYKLVDDNRVTGVGRYLRKLSLDELPQFWNVLRGDMSVVGPRPPLPFEVDEYEGWHKRRLAIQPGVTGLWQVQSRSNVAFDEMVFQDVMYGLTHDLFVDSQICLKTVPAAISGNGAA